MSLTALIWLCTFAALAVLSFRRASWGIALYMLTFYIDPNFWWWGSSISSMAGERFSIAAALILAVAVLVSNPRLRAAEQSVFIVLLLYALNATVIHFALADNPERSARGLELLWKQIGLAFLIVSAIRDKVDWKIFLWSMLIGSLYIGCELVINDRGHFSAGRYERSVASGIGDSNYLAGFMSLVVPLGGYFLLTGKWKERLLALITLVLVCDVIVLCDSRGGFLALLAGGAWLLFCSRGRARRYALYGLLLGSLAIPVLVRDQRIIDRFMTTFVSTEHRDRTQTQRLDYWAAALRMLGDNPIGSGAEAAFKSNLGFLYIAPLGDTHFRAVHNGYCDVACAWGVQGISLYLLALFLAWRVLRKATRLAGQQGDRKAMFLGYCIQAAFVSQFVSSIFISSFDGEWFFWLIGLAAGYARVSALAPSSIGSSPVRHLSPSLSIPALHTGGMSPLRGDHS